MKQLVVQLSEALRPCAELAVLRLGYLFPKLTFNIDENSIVVSGIDAESEHTMRQEVHYALYREKIYAETLSMRRSLLDAVTQP